MYKILLLLPLLFVSGCFKAVVCEPTYVPSGTLAFEDLSDMPIKLQVTDSRTGKFFFKQLWVKCWDPDLEKKPWQPIELVKPPQTILRDSLLRVLNEYGYAVTHDAPTTIEVNLTEFLYTADGDPVFANIKLNASIKNSQRVFTRRHFVEYTEKKLDSFRQYQDAEPVLSKCLSKIVERFTSDKEILKALRISYGKPTSEETTKPPFRAKARPEIRAGTGFAISEDGHIATAYHVIKDAKTIKVYLSKDSFVSARVIHGDPANDLTLLKIENPTPNFLQITQMRSVKTGDRVFTIGFPISSVLGQEAKYTEGVVSSLSGLKGASSLLQITVPVQPGNSGGPLVNEKGEVVGIITSTAAILPFIEKTGSLPQNINWAVKADYLRPLIELPKAEQKEFDREQLIGHVKKSTFLIEAE